MYRDDGVVVSRLFRSNFGINASNNAKMYPNALLIFWAVKLEFHKSTRPLRDLQGFYAAFKLLKFNSRGAWVYVLVLFDAFVVCGNVGSSIF